MRLTSLVLTNYGVFQSERIDLDPAPGRINLLIAPNGAGKSILRGAFCDLLFGVGAQTPMGFRYGYKDMRLLAHAETATGAVVFGRRKGQGNTLIDAGGQKMEPATLAALLGGADRALLERLFALDTERLRLGGQALLASDGALAEALVSASGGLRQARDLRGKLEAARDGLAPTRRTQSRPFYQALDQFLGARNRVAATMLKPEARERQEAERKILQEKREAFDLSYRRATRRLAQLDRVRRVRPLLAELDQHAAWLAAHPEAPALRA
ncbi:MAG TPA: AAA family ATPase, partial [Acetobacteraceae bacterium]|nr:AAA family ATPase [Acetobacteraceae bacterium]